MDGCFESALAAATDVLVAGTLGGNGTLDTELTDFPAGRLPKGVSRIVSLMVAND